MSAHNQRRVLRYGGISETAGWPLRRRVESFLKNYLSPLLRTARCYGLPAVTVNPPLSVFLLTAVCSLLCLNAQAALWSGIVDPSRATDWSQAGVVGGIPNRTVVCATINASSYGNGASDATGGIQNALNSCPSGQVVVLSAGTFRINSNVLVPSNVTLRGAGANQTILDAHGSGHGPVILGNGGVTQNAVNASVSIVSGATAGSISLGLASNSGVSIGSYLLVTELNDTSFVTNVGGEGTCTWCDGYWNGTRSRGQIVQVTSVSGSVVGINPALYSAYSHSPLATPFTASASYAGVEYLQVYENNTGYAGDFYMGGCANCWAKGVEGNYADGNFVEVHWGWHDEIRDSYFSNAYTHAPGAYDSDVFLADKTSASLIENNIVERGHVSLMFDWGPAGNVLAYNYTEGEFDANSVNFVIGGVSMHGAHPQFNLMEGNVANQYYPDQVWGSSSHNTTFRNWWEGTTRACSPSSGRGTVSCTGSSGWWPFQASRAEQVSSLATYGNFVGDIAGSANQNALLSFGNPTSHVAILTSPSSRSYDSTNYNMTFGYGESSDSGSGPGIDSTRPYNTALIYNVYTYANGATNCFFNGSASTCSTSLPASFFHSAKPSWWLASLPWPPIGPDVTGGPGANGHAYLIPAQYCYLNVMGGTEGGAGSPLAFNATACYPIIGVSTSSPCDVNGDNATNIVDVQQCVNQSLGVATCTADINKDGICNVVDVQRVVNAALGGQCVTN